MMRGARANRLDIWMNGLPVGYWEVSRAVERLAYRDDWIADEQGRPLSLSLPFTPGNQPYQGPEVQAFFDNLLPDSEAIRRRIAVRYRARDTSSFAMLAELGRDCVGAIQLLPPDEVPANLQSIDGRPLDEAAVAKLLRDTTATNVLGRHDPVGDLRLSIAGAQEKTALLWHGGQWLLPAGTTPTTHIFKLPLGLVGNMQADMPTSVENEWLCSKIVAAYGLPVADCAIARFDDQKVLVVTRFDRRLASNRRWILRLPQEDMCQATGTPALRKYQSDGGPGIERIMEILSSSEDAASDRRNFFVTQIVFWLLAATDGHAKNFSIAHFPQNQYRSTPLYDVLSAHPIIGNGRNRLARQKAKLAMSVRSQDKHYHIEEIQQRHWIAQGARIGYPAAQVEEMIGQIALRTDAVIDQVSAVLPDDFPADVAAKVFDGMRRFNKRLIATQ
ncbi:MAG TPA: type II toxin-antitoxin system HipA family toxin [Paraburkholderia sp.]|jgi:serine/threonine-protein kinase HipA